MISIHRRSPPAPKTDIQSRLRVIQDRARKLRGPSRTPPSDSEGEVAVLAYLVDYLAGIVEKHLREGER